jgi:hypothetical protein
MTAVIALAEHIQINQHLNVLRAPLEDTQEKEQLHVTPAPLDKAI